MPIQYQTNKHPLYTSLGQTDEERQAAYRELFRYELEPGEIDEIRETTNGSFALEDSRFKQKISKILGRRVTPGQAGRPRKNPSRSR
ncbi:MAG: hypothetical protein GXP57_02260 [Deltaproteobacteria bacterium]|nr:hypothetical protein [Deltaproteobacteria bacterium]